MFTSRRAAAGTALCFVALTASAQAGVSTRLELDGRPISQLLEQSEQRISGATAPARRRSALGRVTRSRDGTPRSLLLAASGRAGRPLQLELRPLGHDEQIDYPRGAAFREPEPGLFYVDLDRVSDADFEAALARGIIFDLRGYPGGVSPLSVLPHLITERAVSAQFGTPEPAQPNRTQTSFSRRGEWKLDPAPEHLSAPCVFLSGSAAISEAESWLRVVKHHRIGTIVGAARAGTNGDACSIEVPGGDCMTWTGMRVLKHDGSRHHGVGIQPDVPATRTRAGVAAGRDEVLETGLEVLREAR